MHLLSPQQCMHIIINEALTAHASDIYVDSIVVEYRKCISVAYRIHGVCGTPHVLSLAPHDEFFRYIRIVMGIRIDSEHVPHDGACTFKSLGLDIAGDIRCAIIPSIKGYACTLRISASYMQNLSLLELGCADNHVRDIHTMMRISAGLVIVTGPTGSGKTTLLHTMIQERAERDMVIAIEDPVEVELSRVRHIEINEYVGRTYAKCLKSVLRQSPDCILIGELRDADTVAIAIQSALTGHSVYASLHTYGISTVVSRLVDLGATITSIHEVIRGVIATRLVRTLCSVCHGDYESTHCNCRKGYSGRTGIFETSSALQGSYISMKEHGQRKVENSITTIEEIDRVLA